MGATSFPDKYDKRHSTQELPYLHLPEQQSDVNEGLDERDYVHLIPRQKPLPAPSQPCPPSQPPATLCCTALSARRGEHLTQPLQMLQQICISERARWLPFLRQYVPKVWLNQNLRAEGGVNDIHVRQPEPAPSTVRLARDPHVL